MSTSSIAQDCHFLKLLLKCFSCFSLLAWSACKCTSASTSLFHLCFSAPAHMSDFASCLCRWSEFWRCLCTHVQRSSDAYQCKIQLTETIISVMDLPPGSVSTCQPRVAADTLDSEQFKPFKACYVTSGNTPHPSLHVWKECSLRKLKCCTIFH